MAVRLVVQMVHVKAAHLAGNLAEQKARRLVVPSVDSSAAYWAEELAGYWVVPMVALMGTSKAAHSAVWLAEKMAEPKAAQKAVRSVHQLVGNWAVPMAVK